jgi:ribosomal protein S12 methylthiotransferase
VAAGVAPVAYVCFVTVGCAKNEVDTNRMRALVRASELAETDDPAAADIVVVNTCSFITEATEESLEVIFDVLALDGFAEGRRRLIVAGCMPARYGDELASELGEAAGFLAPGDEDHVVEACYEALGRSAAGKEGQAPLPPAAPQAALRVVEAPWAYVKVSDGCSRRCSFCTIPAIRGPYRSRPYAEVVAEVDALVEGGVREIVLIGQDTGIWGCDLNGLDDGRQRQDDPETPRRLATLLDALARRHPSIWLRVMYLQPQGVTDELLAVMAAHPSICPYLDLPLQHVSARVLREMNRSGDADAYLRLVGRIRAALPQATLRTTLIAGFPGETRADAVELERFVDQANYDYIGVFAYSQEDITPAGQRADQVPPRTRRARRQRLRDRADAVGFARAAGLVGSTLDVLVCGEDEEGVYGRTQGQAPDVDGVVHLANVALWSLAQQSPAAFALVRIGDVVRARITDTSCYDLYGELAMPPSN